MNEPTTLYPKLLKPSKPVGIIGYGVVGRALAKVFGYQAGNPQVRLYDKLLRGLNSPRHRTAIQACDVVFVAVPTPEAPDGSCDVTAVEEVVSWVTAPMCSSGTSMTSIST